MHFLFFFDLRKSVCSYLPTEETEIHPSGYQSRPLPDEGNPYLLSDFWVSSSKPVF